MPKRDWLGNGVLLAFAVGVLFFLGLCMLGVGISEYAKVHEVNAAYQKNAEEDRKRAAEEVAEACERGAADLGACVSQHLETYYRDQSTNQDLQAQKDMAFWAAAIFFLGILQFFLSGAGVYLLINSLSQTAKGLNLANKAIVVENRPWLKFEVVGNSDLFFHETGTILTMRLKITNVGNNPAQRVYVDSCPLLSSGNSRDEMEAWAEKNAQKYKSLSISNSIFPKGEMASGAGGRTPIAMIEIERNRYGETMRDMVTLVYAVAVFYTSDIDDSFFYTVSIYSVEMKNAVHGSLPIPYKLGNKVLADDLAIIQAHWTRAK
jgi:hypothetical protein